MKKIFAYDLECLSNFFSAKFENIYAENDRYTFIISSTQNDSLALIQFVTQDDLRLVSYNGHHYDDVLIAAFLDALKELDTKYLYKISKTIIDSNWKEYPEWLKKLIWFSKPFESIDLLKLVSVNKTRPSLKSCGLHLKYPRIQDFLVNPHKPIKESDIPILLDYQDDDVAMAKQLYLTISQDIELREAMSKRYNLNIVSSGDSGITDNMLEVFYGEKPIPPEPPKIIYVKNLLPSKYKFKTEKLLKFKRELSNVKLYSPSYKFPMKKVTIGKTTYSIGVGGLHSTEKSRYFESNNNTVIRDADVTSYYVNLMLTQKIKPRHLTEKFWNILSMLLDERVAGKRENDPVRRDGLKIPVLGFFGKMNFSSSFIYDPEAFFRVTIGGQILLLNLIESLEMNGIAVISGNTDGILCQIPRQLENRYFEICQEWQQRTELDLEYTTYTKFAQRDVNNYIAITDDGKTKTKGIFVDRLKLTKRDFVYAFNAPIISLALQSYFKDGIEPKDTINNHTDIYDFMYSQKTDKKYKTHAKKIQNGKLINVELQKTNRWIVSKTGGYYLEKLHQEGGRDSAHMKGVQVALANDINDVSLPMIDKQYYIDETWKIIEEIEGKKGLVQKGLI